MNSKAEKQEACSVKPGDWITTEIDGRERNGIVTDTIEDNRGCGIVIRIGLDTELIVGPEHVISTE